MRALRTPGGAVKQDMIAGAYFWLSVPDGPVSLARVRRAFRANGMDTSRLPKERRPEHVLQEACRRVEGTSQNGAKVVVRAEQVIHDTTEVVYQITRHVTDAQSRVIQHPKALRVTYTKDTGELHLDRLEGMRRAEFRDLEQRIRGHFENGATKIAGHNLRRIVRHYLQEVGAEDMRGLSGGVYFLATTTRLRADSVLAEVHGERLDGLAFLDSLGAMLGEVYPAPEFHMVPCLNDATQRAFLKDKFIENIAVDVDDFCERLNTLLARPRKRVFRQDLVANMVVQRDELAVRLERFAEVVGGSLPELKAAVRRADETLGRFLEVNERAAA